MFQVRHTEESANRTFRFPKSLLDKMTAVAQQENVSLNNFVVQCCEYAINSMQQTEEKSSEN